VLPQQLRYRGVLAVLGNHERRVAAGGLQRGTGLGVEQRLHDRSVAMESSAHQGGAAAGALQVDARAALQQHSHHRLLPSIGGPHQQRRTIVHCAPRVHAAALAIQPRSHGLVIAHKRRVKQGPRQTRLRLVS
jgi:hypothetical protein